MIDAEHSYFQPAIEQLVLDLQRKYNCMGRGERPIIFGCVRACVLACNRRWAGRPQRTNGRRWVWARRGGWWGSVDQQLVVMTGADLFSLSLSLSLSLSHTHTHTHTCVRACVRACSTYQCYLRASPQKLRAHIALAEREGWHFAAKLVPPARHNGHHDQSSGLTEIYLYICFAMPIS
jgi:hypothetical protein